jgi:exonuclease-1
VQVSNLASVTSSSNKKKNSSFLFVHFTPAMFRQVCILAGCDYLSSIPGLGVKTACQLIKKYKDAYRVTSDLVSVFF